MKEMEPTRGQAATQEMQLDKEDKVFIGSLIDTLWETISKTSSREYMPAKESLALLIGSYDREDLSGALVAVDSVLKELRRTAPGLVPDQHHDMELRAEAIRDLIERRREAAKPLQNQKPE